MKLHTENSHMDYYKGWGYMGNDGERDYYISINPKGKKLLSIVHSNEPSDYSSPGFDMVEANPSHYYNSPCKGYKELVKRLAEYGHLDINTVISEKFCKDTNKNYQLRIDGNVYVDLGCGWFKSLFTTEKDFNNM